MDSKKKIVWLINEYSSPVSSPLSRYFAFARLLEQNGYEVYVIVGSSQNKSDEHYIPLNGPLLKKMKIEGVKYVVVKRLVFRSSVERVLGSIYFQGNIWRLRNQIPKPYAIVQSLTGLFGNVVFKWKKWCGTKVIFDVFDLWPEEFVMTNQIGKNNPFTKMMYRMEYHSYRDADGIIFCVEGGKDYIIDKKWDIDSGGKVDISKIRHINNGTNLIYLRNAISKEMIEDDDLLSDKFKVVYIGAMNAVNDLDILVESAREMQMQSSEVIFLVYGDGTTRERLQNLADKYMLSNIVFKGYLHGKYAPYVISKCNLCFWNFKDISLLKYGISNNKFFLYTSCEKPVLATFKANYDILEKQGCGIIVDKNPKAVREGIMKFVNMSNAEYKSYCDNSKMVSEKYDYNNTVGNLIELLNG